MSDWLTIDPQRLSSASTKRSAEKGVELTISLSPYDIPDGVRSRTDAESRRFIIEFSYIEDEPWDFVNHGKYVSLKLGKQSGRLRGIELNLASIAEDQVSIRMEVPNLVSKAIKNLPKTPLHKRRLQNYLIATRVLSERNSELLEGLELALP
jgi:hypothetical protein